MGIFGKISELFSEEEDDPAEQVCPVCGSTCISPINTIENFYDVVLESKVPIYHNGFLCLHCGYRS